jgi:hypothetical protein
MLQLGEHVVRAAFGITRKPAFGRHAGTGAGGSGLELTVKLARYLLHTVLKADLGES